MKRTYSNHKECQKCANCCKVAWFYTHDKDDAIRFSWLKTDKITVAKIKKGAWKITVHIPCKMLVKKGNKFYCNEYKGRRPNYCKAYPINIKGQSEEVIEAESKVCPIIKKVANRL